MENNLNEELECKDCANYIQHYFKYNGQLRKSDGHCIERKPNGHFRKTDKICEYFNQRDLQKEKEYEIRSATELLAVIVKQVKDLSQILKLLAEEIK